MDIFNRKHPLKSECLAQNSSHRHQGFISLSLKLHFSMMFFFLLSFSHVSGNKIGWEKPGTQSEGQTRGELGDQTKVFP